MVCVSGGDDLQLRQLLLQAAEGVLLDGGSPVQPVLIFHGRPAGGGKASDLGGGFGAGAKPFLLAAAGEHGLEPYPLLHVQGADPLGSAQLVAADGDQVGPQGGHGKGHLQKALDGVTVEEDILVHSLGRPDAVGHRQDGTHLVVDQHHGHQGGVGAEGGTKIVHRDAARPIRLEIGHLITLFFQIAAGLQHGGVLDGGGDDMLAPAARQFHALTNGPVVPLGAARGKKHLGRRAAQGLGHRLPVGLHPRGGLLAVGIAGGGIAEGRQRLGDGGHHFRADRRGGGVIKIAKLTHS